MGIIFSKFLKYTMLAWNEPYFQAFLLHVRLKGHSSSSGCDTPARYSDMHCSKILSSACPNIELVNLIAVMSYIIHMSSLVLKLSCTHESLE